MCIIVLKTFFFVTDANQIVSIGCLNWINIEFTYPDQVTDLIIFHQCSGGHEETLRKVKSTKT